MQILLPQDYLRPPVPQYNRAIGTNNLRRGLKALKVARHFIFLDACRNDHENLKQQDAIEGERILTPVAGARRNPRCLVPLFFASAAGEQAFQPVDPKQGVSLFGRALLEGLGAVGLEPTCDDRRCVVNLDPLLGYCKQRIPQIAKVEFGQDLEQEVRLSGDYVQDPVTEVTRTRTLPPTALSISENRAARLSVHPTVPPSWRPESFGDAHIVFGSERVTDPFVNDAWVYSYSQNQWLGRGQDFVIHHVSHAEDRTLYEVDLELSQPQQRGACWFEISDPVRRFGMVLPPTQQSVRYRLEFEMAFDHTYGEPSRFSRIALYLSEKSPAPYSTVASAWDAYRDENVTSAAKIMLSPHAADDMEHVLAEKVRAPLGAAIAGLLMVRGNQWRQLHDWLRNLANLFPEIPDGPALWAEQLLREHPANSLHRREALQYLLMLEARAIPFLSEVVGLAYSRMVEFVDEPDVIATERDKLTKQIDRYRTPVMLTRPGGLFTVWAGPPSEIVPEMVLPR